MSLTTRVLIGLAAGLLVGFALSRVPPAVGASWRARAAGTIFINLIRMTVIPLVASMLIASVGSLRLVGRARTRRRTCRARRRRACARSRRSADRPGRDAGARRGSRSIRARRWRCAARRRRDHACSTTAATPAIAQWFIDLVSPNVVKAAADGAMLPVIMFAVLFGLALPRVSTSAGTPCSASRRVLPTRCSGSWPAFSSSRRSAYSRSPCRWRRSSGWRPPAPSSRTSCWS